MNTTKYGMRALLASAAAGALVLGSAAGVATAKGKPDSAPAPQSTVKLQSVSIKGHSTIDVGVKPAATVNVRTTIWDPKNVLQDKATVVLTLAAYTKKVNGQLVEAIKPIEVPALTAGKMTKKTDRYVGSVTLSDDTIGQLQSFLGKDQKTYLCISTATVDPAVGKYSVKVQKRLGVKGPQADAKLVKPVRDCVKVVDSTIDPAPVAPAQ